MWRQAKHLCYYISLAHVGESEINRYRKTTHPDACFPVRYWFYQVWKTEDWTTYSQRAGLLCRQMMKEEQQGWDQGTFLPQDDPGTLYWQEKIPSMVHYFCLTAWNR